MSRQKLDKNLYKGYKNKKVEKKLDKLKKGWYKDNRFVLFSLT